MRNRPKSVIRRYLRSADIQVAHGSRTSKTDLRIRRRSVRGQNRLTRSQGHLPVRIMCAWTGTMTIFFALRTGPQEIRLDDVEHGCMWQKARRAVPSSRTGGRASSDVASSRSSATICCRSKNCRSPAGRNFTIVPGCTMTEKPKSDAYRYEHYNLSALSRKPRRKRTCPLTRRRMRYSKPSCGAVNIKHYRH